MNAARSVILIINGPNLNMLGRREPEIYGHTTLAEIEEMCRRRAREYKKDIDFRQSNHEGALVTWIQDAAAQDFFSGLIINAAAYTHSSIAIHDALKLLSIPVVEVHLSDPKKREAFRHHSYIAPVAATVIAGQGAAGYERAIDWLEANS